MTEKLYYSDGECRAFTARVVSCEAENGAYCVVLDRTAVFPGGGRAGGGRVEGSGLEKGAGRGYNGDTRPPGQNRGII